MSKILETSCFAAGSLSAEEVAGFLRPEALRFEPERISSNEIDPVRGTAFRAELHVEAVARSSRLEWLSVRGAAGERFDFSALEAWEMQLLDWKLPWERRHEPEFFEELARRPGFAVAYAGDADDIFWQTERNPGNWEALGRDWQGQRLVDDPVMGGKIIDVSRNPGRIELAPGMRLQACWRMWFGPGSARHFDRARILAFGEAASSRLLDSGTVFVELYEEGRRPEFAEHRRVQRRFRDWTEMDTVSERTGQPAEPPDPEIELETGVFEHGGTRRATLWLREEGTSAPRSEASRKRVVELDDSGEVIWTGEIERA